MRERFHCQVDTKWVSNENLWRSSHCHLETVISVICYYQHFSCHWFYSYFSNKRKIVACSLLLFLLVALPSFLSHLFIMHHSFLFWGGIGGGLSVGQVFLLFVLQCLRCAQFQYLACHSKGGTTQYSSFLKLIFGCAISFISIALFKRVTKCFTASKTIMIKTQYVQQ